MAKNITIQEGLVARNFTSVKKLSTTQMNSGEKISWIPEDEVLDYVTLKELKVIKNGTYKAEDKNCDGFDKVKVDISADVVPQKTITTNGEYDAMQDDGRVGYAHVTVNVPGGGGGPFTVLFLDDEGNVLKKQENVPYGGYASCTALDGTIRNGLYFKGWNPVPKNVQFNMTCRPVRGDYQIISGEILDDWETIVADGGAHYPLGSYKSIVFNVPQAIGFMNVLNHFYSGGVYYDGVVALSRYQGYSEENLYVSQRNVACHMVKVAEGEDGSTSSWISDGVLHFASGFDDLGTGNQYRVNGTASWKIREGWMGSKIRKYLNENFYAAMPDPVKNAIVPVNKTFKAANITPSMVFDVGGAGVQMLDESCIDSIWVPSVKEFHSYFSQTSSWAAYSPCEELQGIDYSTVFTPIFDPSVPYTFRTLGAPGGYQVNYLTASNGNITHRDSEYAMFGFCL